jgi:hypothetical protein
MKKRIVLLAYTQSIHDGFLSGLKRELIRAGHDVRSVFTYGKPRNDSEVVTNYADFDLFAIESFKPDCLIVFNGYAKETTAVVGFLRGRYKTFFVERGWLPQRGTVYIDALGLGGRSSISCTDLSIPTAPMSVIKETIGALRETTYKTSGHPDLGDYILVPLQLDHDTSIVLDSPYFKSMHSLVAFLSRKFFNQKVVVRPHPLCMDIRLPSSVIVERERRTIDLAKTAKAIIGINSTVLIESLIHHKPVCFMGRGVLSSTRGIAYQDHTALQSAELAISGKEPDADAIDTALYNLLQIQFHASSPPERVIKQIELAV